jgi:antitoxin component of MazEF toxin-antitoxin module
MAMRATYQKGQAIEVPAELLEEAGVEDGAALEIELTPEGGVLVHPVVRVRHALEGEDDSYTLDEFFEELERGEADDVTR